MASRLVVTQLFLVRVQAGEFWRRCGIAKRSKAHGSYPCIRWFESTYRYRGKAAGLPVQTHNLCNAGSIPAPAPNFCCLALRVEGAIDNRDVVVRFHQAVSKVCLRRPMGRVSTLKPCAVSVRIAPGALRNHIRRLCTPIGRETRLRGVTVRVQFAPGA
jgi:hypothetical protein